MLLLSAPCAHAADRLTIHERPLNTDRDRGLEAIEVRCDARFAIPGSYTIALYMADVVDYYGYGVPELTWARGIGRSPFPARRGSPAGHEGWFDITTDSLGRARVTAYFYCDELSRMQADGPWRLSIYARLKTGLKGTYSVDRVPRETLSVMTRPWKRSEFDFNYRGELFPPDYNPLEDWRPGHELVFTQGYDLVAVTVMAADSAGTQGHPPVVRARVDEVLRGGRKPGGMRVSWDPRPLWMPCPVGEEETIRRWDETPIVAPPVGSRWILGGYAAKDTSIWVSVSDSRWAYSDTLRQHFLDEAAPWSIRLQKLKDKQDVCRIGPQQWWWLLLASLRQRERHDGPVRLVGDPSIDPIRTGDRL